MLNAQSAAASKKRLQITDMLSTLSPSLLFITETFYNQTISNQSILGNSPYSLLRNDRIEKRGGGVAIFIYSQLHYILVNHDNPNILAVDIIQNQNSSTRYILIYRPPKFTKPQSTILFDNVREVMNIPSIFPVNNVVLLGDLNYPDIKWDSDLFTQAGAASPLIDFVLEKNLHQHVLEPTRKDNILDLIFSTDLNDVFDVKITDPIGDHNVIHFKTSNKFVADTEQITYSDFKNGDYDALNCFFNLINWKEELDNFTISNDIFDFIRKVIKDGISKFIPTRIYDPTKNIPVNQQKAVKFYLQNSRDPSKTTIVNESIKKLNKEFIKFTKNQQRKLFLKNIENSKEERKNVTNIFNYVSPFLKQKSSNIPVFLYDGKPAITKKDQANALGKYLSSVYNPYSPPDSRDQTTSNEILQFISYSENEISKMLKKCKNKNVNGVDNIPGYVLKKCADSLCKPFKILFDYIIDHNMVPDLFLLSYVTPLPKIPKPTNVEHYRPISGTPDAYKTMERCIKPVIMKFLNDKNYFPKQQYGFRAKMSTIQQLIPFQEFIISSVSKKMTVDVIYFDFEKAFDKIPIDRLIRALKKAGITGKLLNLIISLLSFRKFKVKVGNEFSEEFEATSGVPQGSVLGPILFIIFITELSEKLSTLPGILHLLFADDLKIYFAYYRNSFDVSIIQNAINAVFNWSSENSMPTSTSKIFHIQYGPKNETAKYFINNVPISTVPIVRDLGIMLENNLQPNAHIKKVVGSAMASLFAIMKRVIISNQDVLIFLFNVYVRPILEYGSQLFNIQVKKIANYLERPQKIFTRMLYRRQNRITDIKDIPRYPERLKKYNMKSLHERRNIIDLQTGFEFLHTTTSNDSSLQHQPTRDTRYQKDFLPNFSFYDTFISGLAFGSFVTPSMYWNNYADMCNFIHASEEEAIQNGLNNTKLSEVFQNYQINLQHSGRNYQKVLVFLTAKSDPTEIASAKVYADQIMADGVAIIVVALAQDSNSAVSQLGQYFYYTPSYRIPITTIPSVICSYGGQTMLPPSGPPYDPLSDAIGTPCSTNVANVWLDVVFVVDISNAMNVKELNDWALEILTAFYNVPFGPRGPHKTRAGIITYATDATPRLNIADGTSNDAVQQALLAVKKFYNASDSGGYIQKALKAAQMMLADTASIDGYPKDYRQQVVVLTAAAYDDVGFQGANETAQILKNNGVKIFTINYRSSSGVLIPGLDALASQGYAYRSDDVNLPKLMSLGLTQVNCFCPPGSLQFSYYNGHNTTNYADCFVFHNNPTLPSLVNLLGCPNGATLAVTSQIKLDFITDRILSNFTSMGRIKRFLTGAHKNLDGNWYWWGYNKTEYPVGHFPVFNPAPGDSYSYLDNYFGLNWRLAGTTDDATLPFMCQNRACDAGFIC